jgi:hypothetical protein
MTVLSPTIITYEVEQDYRNARGYSLVDYFQISLERQFGIGSRARRARNGFEITGSSFSYDFNGYKLSRNTA